MSEEPNELENAVWEAVGTVVDPDLRMSLRELGLIYGISIDENKFAFVTMTLTSMGCPAAPFLMSAVEEAAKGVDGISGAKAELVWEPRWNPAEMASEEAQMKLGIL